MGESATGVQGVASQLTSTVTSSAIWDSISPFVPFIGGMILVSIGIYAFRRVTKKASRLKGGM